MKQFSDNKKRAWSVQVDVSAVKRVRGLCNVDLLAVADGQLLQRLITEPVLLVDVIFALCQPQAASLGVTDVDFGESMAGDAIEAATKALIEEIVSFSPNPRDRAALGKVVAAMERAMEKAREKVAEKLTPERLDLAVEEAVSRAMTSGGPSGAAPGSAG